MSSIVNSTLVLKSLDFIFYYFSFLITLFYLWISLLRTLSIFLVISIFFSKFQNFSIKAYGKAFLLGGSMSQCNCVIRESPCEPIEYFLRQLFWLSLRPIEGQMALDDEITPSAIGSACLYIQGPEIHPG